MSENYLCNNIKFHSSSYKNKTYFRWFFKKIIIIIVNKKLKQKSLTTVKIMNIIQKPSISRFRLLFRDEAYYSLGLRHDFKVFITTVTVGKIQKF